MTTEDKKSDTNTDPENNQNTGEPKNKTELDPNDPDLVSKLVAQKVAEELAELKKKLDSAYGQRDDALTKLQKIEEDKRTAEIRALEEAGKHKEAFELKEAEWKANLKRLEEKNTELTRDATLKTVLLGYEFRNENAAAMAYQAIVSELVKDEKGGWVHRSGVSIRDYVDVYAKAEENSFLFKPKTNSGAGTPPLVNNGNRPADTQKPASLFNRPVSEVVKLAEEGKLPHQLKNKR